MKKIFLLLLASFMLNGCFLAYIDSVGPLEEGYWWKDGYTKETTREFLEKRCGYEKHAGDDVEDYERSKKVYLHMKEKSDQCMLKNGFIFMKEKVHNGFLLIDTCGPGEFSENTPACKSYRERINNTPWWKKLFDWYY